MRHSLKFAVLFAVLGTVPAMYAQTTYSTVGQWNGTDYSAALGVNPNGTPNYGETFVAPTNATLSSFTFYLDDAGMTPTTVQIQATVYAWDGSLYGGSGSPEGTSGAALFTSNVFNYTGNGTFQPVTVNTGNLQLTTGDDYIVVFTAVGGGDADVLMGEIPYPHQPGDGGGGLNFSFGNTPAGVWNPGDGGDENDFGDLAYTATFGATPEPGSFLLLGTGLLGVAGMMRRRRSA